MTRALGHLKISLTHIHSHSLWHTHKHMLQTLVFSSGCMLLAAHFRRKQLIIHMTEGLHWLYRGTPRMDFTPMTSKKYVSVTGSRIWEGLVYVFLFIHSVIYAVQSSKLFPAPPCFFLPSSHIQNIQGTDTRDASHINASHFLPCCTVHKHTGFLLFMSEQRSILRTQCYWIPNYPRVLNFWLISHGLV